METICKKCKHNKPGTNEIIITTKDSKGVVNPWAGLGDQCDRVNCSMWDIQECTGFEQLKLTAVIEKTNTGYSGYIKEIDGIVTVGDTIDEMKENILDVLKEHYDYLIEKGTNVPNMEYIQIEYIEAE